MLRDKYSKCDDLCIFIANYNIYDCELDGIIIKSDAIIGVEFKNYGGEITATENGHWKLADGTIIKGGSNKSVYQQAKINHVAIRKGLKEGAILPSKMLQFVPALVVFNKPISLLNNLSERTQSWLHICDVDHFIEKVEDITTPNFYLTNEQIMELIPKLGLMDEFVDSRFTVDVTVIHNETESGYTDETKDSDEGDTGVLDNEEPEPNDTDKPIESQPISEGYENDVDSIKDSYRNFLVENVMPALNLEKDYKLIVVHYSNFESIMGLPLPFKSEYVAILQSEGIEDYQQILKRLFHKQVIPIMKSVLVWGEGEINISHELDSPRTYKTTAEVKTISRIQAQDGYVLPKWLDDFIFFNLGAKYQPAYSRFEFNIDLTAEESKVYLGTYFPRSYAESYSIFSSLFKSETIKSIISAKRSIKILDFGCGSGGEIFGLLQALEDIFSTSVTVEVAGVDGNHNSLRLFEKIVNQYNGRGHHFVKLTVAPAFIESESDFNDIAELIGNGYDFIITSKAIGEFERKKQFTQNGYEFFSSLFAPLLSDTGIMIILDVTIKDENTNMFLPQRMNIGVNKFLEATDPAYQSLVPCSGRNGTGFCKQKCFFKYETCISHSKKSKDISKFALRILSRRGLYIETSIFNNDLYNISCAIK
jgi:SAM-dependent methyltransferase